VTLEDFFSSKWCIGAAFFCLGLLVERLHMIRVVDKQRAFTKRSKEIIVELVQAHGWLRTNGTPQTVLDRIEHAAAAIHDVTNEVR
jgi:hypothetical protein